MAQTNVYEDGTEERTYPYANMFAHVVGYDTNGKSGLESEANFQLLTSHEFFLNQMKNEFKNQKNTGDSVVTTLNADLQTTAYNALGDRRGAVVAMIRIPSQITGILWLMTLMTAVCLTERLTEHILPARRSKW